MGSLLDGINLAEAPFLIDNVSRHVVDGGMKGQLIYRISADLFFFILNQSMFSVELIKP